MNFRSFSKTLTAIVLFLFLAGCQSMGSSYGVGSVSPEDRAPFPPGQNSGTWKGSSLVVDYKYSRTQSDLDMTGTVNFLDNITMNFVLLRDFQVSIIFVDENGKVLATQGLTTGRGAFDPIPFHVKMTAPQAAVAMSFSYKGTAIEGGRDEGGGVTNFWQYPIH